MEVKVHLKVHIGEVYYDINTIVSPHNSLQNTAIDDHNLCA